MRIAECGLGIEIGKCGQSIGAGNGTKKDRIHESKLESLVEAGLVKAAKLKLLMQEADELVAIVVESINTTRGHAR